MKKRKTTSHEGISEIAPSSLADLHEWLKKNHKQKEGLWVILPKKGSGIPGITVDQLIDEALCWGWIDSLPRKIDDTRYKLYISPRNPKSNWSKVNKDKVARLEKEERIQPSGKAAIELAKSSGTWIALDAVEALEVPKDLEIALKKQKEAWENFSAFPRSAKRGILEWIAQAKKSETREKRIQETAELASKNIRANQYLVGKAK